MKKCPYCGKQYSDDASVCPIDKETLITLAMDREKAAGGWRSIWGGGIPKLPLGEEQKEWIEKSLQMSAQGIW